MLEGAEDGNHATPGDDDHHQGLDQGKPLLPGLSGQSLFLLLPRFTSTGCWRIAALGLMGLVFAAVFAGRRRGEGATAAFLPVVVVVGSTILMMGTGPTAFWRHGGVATGSDFFQGRATVTEMTDFLRLKRRIVAWETDGVESSLAQMTSNGLAVSSNGKIDGNSLLDAPTQVMLGLLCGLFHPQPKSSLVVGLGSGSTAGWLGRIRPMERVDVVEIEPAMVTFARNCTAVNAAALDNPKLHLAFNDAREYLQTSHRTWDLIVSEPSNPYRAGIVSLFTREFYQAVAQALNPRGVFGQWVQSYSIDKPTFDTILATLCSVFPQVSVWQTASYDLLFVCSQEPLDHSVPRLRSAIQEEPFRSAFGNCWRADDLEGVLARFLANPATVRAYLASVPADLPLNTDDRMIVEFGFARAVGKPVVSPIGPLLASRNLPANWNGFRDGPIDLGLVHDLRSQIWALEGMVPGPGIWDPLANRTRITIYDRFVRGDLQGVRSAWSRMASSPVTTYDLCVLGEALADIGHGSTSAVLDLLEPRFPGEAAAIRARWLFGNQRYEESLQEITRAFTLFQTNPWTNQTTFGRAVDFAGNLVDRAPGAAEKLFQAARQPFCLYGQEEKRLDLLLGVAQHVSPEATVEALHEFEPDTPWNGLFLKLRRDVYRQTGDPATLLAETEYQQFRRESGRPSDE
ncbi:MAG: fused MFS/spermidine synthase [Candidatus Riflebacteria bacterium]|nr:fused MFS/spermidine synthase [Candidatus Riflebacteria bacterium]